MNTGGSSSISLIVKGAASQSADLAQFQNSSGTVLAKVTSSGSINVAGLSINNESIFDWGTIV